MMRRLSTSLQPATTATALSVDAPKAAARIEPALLSRCDMVPSYHDDTCRGRLSYAGR